MIANGEVVQPGLKTSFTHVFENLENVSTFAVGAPLVQNTSFICEMDPDKLCFKGQIKNMYLFPNELSNADFPKCFKIYNKSDDDKEKLKMDQASEELLASSIFNLKGFVRTSKLKADEINFSTSLSKKEKANKTKSILSIFKKAKPLENEKIEVKNKNVFLLEKLKLEDLIFSIGDLSTFLMSIKILSKTLEPDQASDILCDIIRVFKQFAEGEHLADVVRFLMSIGFYIFADIIEDVRFLFLSNL